MLMVSEIKRQASGIARVRFFGNAKISATAIHVSTIGGGNTEKIETRKKLTLLNISLNT